MSLFFWESTAPSDRACLLLHGLGGGVYEMELLGRSLYQRGLTVQGINYPGHDRPVSKMPASTWEQWYAHVLDTYLSLRQRYRQVTVVGFSTGCLLGLHLATTYPVQQLVLLSPYLAIKHQWYYLFRPEAYLFSLGQLIEDVPRFHLPIRDRSMQAAAEQVIFYKTFNLKAVRSTSQLIQKVKSALPQVQTPTLIIQPRRDSVVEPWGAVFIQENLGSAVKSLSWLEQSDHIIPLDLERESVFEQVGTFLEIASN
nr:alpha/beta fold hydrolase [Neosynechococcus sphagnicola]